MTTTLIVLGTLLTVAAGGSGFAKLAKVPAVMDSMSAVGVTSKQVPILAALEISGAAGLVLGIWYQPLGALAAICLALYFLGAVASHVRRKHGIAELAPAAVIWLIAIAVSALQFAR